MISESIQMECLICGWEGLSQELLVDFDENDEFIFRCPGCEGLTGIKVKSIRESRISSITALKPGKAS